MKHIFLFLVPAMLLQPVHAMQTEVDTVATSSSSIKRPATAQKDFKKTMTIDLTIGPSICTGDKGKDEFGGPKLNAYNQFNARLGYYPWGNFGFYGSITIASYSPRNNWARLMGLQSYRSSWDDQCGIGGDLAIEAGPAFKFSTGRFAFQTRIGIGLFGMGGYGITFYDDDFINDNSTQMLHIWRGIVSEYLSGGITVGYMCSYNVNIIFDLGYRHTFTSSTLIELENYGIHTPELEKLGLSGNIKKKFNSTQWGRDLLLSIGIQFIFDPTQREKKKQKKNNNPG